MAFSPEFRSRMTGQSPSPGLPDGSHDSPNPDASKGNGGRYNGSPDRKDSPNSGSHGKRGPHLSGGSTSTFGNACSDKLPVVQAFPMYRKAPHLHPCDSINEQLLNETQADCALSHDDDWRFQFGNSAEDYEAFNPLESNSVSVRNGVAFLTPTLNNDDPDAMSMSSFDSVDETGSGDTDPMARLMSCIKSANNVTLGLDGREHRKSRVLSLSLPSLVSSASRRARFFHLGIAAPVEMTSLRDPDVDEVYQVEPGDPDPPIHETISRLLSESLITHELHAQSKNNRAVTQPTMSCVIPTLPEHHSGVPMMIGHRPKPGHWPNAPRSSEEALGRHQPHYSPMLHNALQALAAAFVEEQSSLLLSGDRASGRTGTHHFQHRRRSWQMSTVQQVYSRMMRSPHSPSEKDDIHGYELHTGHHCWQTDSPGGESLRRNFIQDHLAQGPIEEPMDRSELGVKSKRQVEKDVLIYPNGITESTCTQRLLTLLVIAWLVSTVFTAPGASALGA